MTKAMDKGPTASVHRVADCVRDRRERGKPGPEGRMESLTSRLHQQPRQAVRNSYRKNQDDKEGPREKDQLGQ